MSVTGPQKRLVQYTGVDTATTTGRPASRAAATVVCVELGVGDGRGAVAARPGVDGGPGDVGGRVHGEVVRPGRGVAGGGHDVALEDREGGGGGAGGRRSTVAATSTSQNPARSNPTVAPYTPRAWAPLTSCGIAAPGGGVGVPGMGR